MEATANPEPIRIIVPSGIRDVMSIDTDTECKLCVGSRGSSGDEESSAEK
jgi:hypothetical protein